MPGPPGRRSQPPPVPGALPSQSPPPSLVGLTFDAGLVDRLLMDLQGDPSALPLLQFTLLRLWENRQRNRVTWEAYERVGGGRRALQLAAEDFYRGLNAEEQEAARR